MKLTLLKAKPYIPLVAMGDIAFLLLVFFLVTSAIDQTRKLEIEIPAARNVTKIPQEEVFNIFIDRYGRIFYKGKERSVFELQFLHLKHISIFTKPIVQVVADEDLDFEVVNEVVETLRRNSKVNVAFSCKEEKR